MKFCKYIQLFLMALFLLYTHSLHAQFISVGSGSYTTSFPGKDAAGRNSYPSGVPITSGVAASKPIPTNDWWSSLIKDQANKRVYNYPLSFRPHSSGLVVNYTVPHNSSATEYREPMSDVNAIIVGAEGLNTSKPTVSNFSDWTVTMNWNDGTNDFNATLGQCMPFMYFTKSNNAVAKVTVNHNPSGVTINGNKLFIKNNYEGANYVVYAPSGSSWTGSGGIYTSTLNGKNYWSMAMLPPGVDFEATASAYEAYAYVFPADTKVAWNYSATTGIVKTTFTTTPDVKEGTNNIVLQGLLPHQWSKLSSSSAKPGSYVYPCVRGQLKMIASNSFTVENKFSGILPNLPDLGKYSNGFDPSALEKKISSIKNDALAEWTDSYNEGQVMNRLIQTARIADQLGDTEARDKMINTVKTRLENWLKADAGEIAFLFYYNNTWKSLLGYPAGHRQDENLNDHHFHWGYFIHAAAAIEQYQPGWAAQWGGMINLLIRDAASPDRNDNMFPFLRNFSPFAGHCWANGFASEPLGNDQESSSESMQFNSALIHWGTVTGNTQIRDLGIYLYTTELSAIQEYWFDINNRTFQPEYAHEMMARIWGAGYDNGTWWTQDIAASYGIQLYPIHGGSLYLGYDTSYVRKVWTGMTAKTPVLSNTPNDNLWYDVYWEYLSFIDPQKAIDLYNAYPNRNIKFGISDAHTYHWLHTMNALGTVKNNITANYPTAVVFEKNGVKTYVAQNYSNTAITVTYSDGYTLSVPAGKMATSKDISPTVTLSTTATQIANGGSVSLTANVTGSGISKVEFYKNGSLVATDNAAPYTTTVSSLAAGLPSFYAKVYVGYNLNISNIVTIQVGSQLPYGGTPAAIPGSIIAANYDVFEGGVGQGVTYSDNDAVNQGTFRPEEGVDAATTAGEGNTVGWIEAGEWLEYTVDVANSGLYNVSIRFASGNTGGGGPFWFEKEDGTKISPDITVPFTDNNWSAYQTKTINNISLQAGKQIIRVKIGKGGFNLGKMTFIYSGGTPPVVNISSPANAATFNAPASVTINANASDADGTISKVEFYNGSVKLGESLTAPYSYTWTGVAAGNYTITAKATDNAGLTTSSTPVNISVANGTNQLPVVSITSPVNNSSYNAPASITLNASASDADGTISKVEFYNGSVKLGESLTSPYSYSWTNVVAGSYTITAKAYDNKNASSTSAAVTVLVSNTPSAGQCKGVGPTAPGENTADYTWQAGNTVNPTITFIPGSPIAGSTLCILYYKVGAGGYVGVNMDVSGNNFTKAINASIGQTVSMYFTYRVGSSGIERNSSTTPHSFTVGQCSDTGPLPNQSPSVNIVSPISGASFTAPASVTINANANDTDGSINKVEFYNGNTKLGEDNTSPYSYTWSGISAGNYSIVAKAYDNNNAVTVSAPVFITVISPSTLGSCSGTAANGDYSYNVTTLGNTVSWTFIPESPIAGSTMSIIYVKVNNGGYAGYTMNTSGSNFIFSKDYSAGDLLSFYFTYRVGNTGMERNSISNPHTYTVGSSCSVPKIGNIFNQQYNTVASNAVELYPNPAISHLYIKGEDFKNFTYTIMDMQGRKLMEGSYNKVINIHNLKTGMYYMILQDNQKKITLTFIKK